MTGATFTPATYRDRRARLAKDIGSDFMLFLGNDDVGINYAANGSCRNEGTRRGGGCCSA